MLRSPNQTTGDMQQTWPRSCVTNYATRPAFLASCLKGPGFNKDSQSGSKSRPVWKSPLKSGNYTPAEVTVLRAIRNSPVCLSKSAPKPAVMRYRHKVKARSSSHTKSQVLGDTHKKEIRAQLAIDWPRYLQTSKALFVFPALSLTLKLP